MTFEEWWRTNAARADSIRGLARKAFEAGVASVTTPAPAPVGEQGPTAALAERSCPHLCDDCKGGPCNNPGDGPFAACGNCGANFAPAAPTVEPETKCGLEYKAHGLLCICLREPGHAPVTNSCQGCGGSGRATP